MVHDVSLATLKYAAESVVTYGGDRELDGHDTRSRDSPRTVRGFVISRAELRVAGTDLTPGTLGTLHDFVWASF